MVIISLKQYSNWDTNFPTNLNQNARCAVMRKSNKKWYDVDCSTDTQSFKFVCEKDAGNQKILDN